MADAVLAGAIPQEKSGSSVRAFAWVAYLATATSLLAFIVLEILGWPIDSPQLAGVCAATLTPQFVTIYNMVRANRPAPSLVLWLALVIVCAAALGLALWATTREFSETVLLGVVCFAWAPAYLALWFNGWSLKESRRWLVQGINLLSASYALIFAAVYVFARESDAFSIGPWLALGLLGLVIVQPLAACLAQAFADQRLPVKPGGEPEMKHISGLGAIFAALFTGSIAALGIWAALGQNGFYIHRDAGLVVAGGLALVFLLVAITPNFRTTDRVVHWLRDTWLIKLIGGCVSTVDGALVFASAGAMGTAQSNDALRYALLISNLVAAGLLGWWLPAPFGLFPIVWAFVSTLAVARRWAWIEEDRENAMLNRNFDGPHIRVGFDQDLRDEALFGFTAILVLVPLALRQVHEAMGSNLFLVAEGANVDHVLPWITFFGTELAKAVPFVDWAEIYQVRGDAPIRVDDASVGAAQHVIFATRVLVDLVLLAALVQAVAVAQRASKLKDMFYEDRTIHRLDPFVEAKALRKLAVGERGSWTLVDPLPAPFRSYDEDRLEVLQSKHSDEAVMFVAAQILRMQSAELLLVEESKLDNPDAAKMEQYLERAQARGDDLAIEDLKAAHYFLNEKSVHLGVREQIISVIADHWRTERAVSALCDFLIVPTSKDRRAEARLAALRGLQVPALNGHREAQVAIRFAAAHDGANKVKDIATAWIVEHPGWGA